MGSVVIAIFLLSIGASFVQRTTGFGFGIFIMTMLPFFLPTYGEATTLSGLLAITTSAVIVLCHLETTLADTADVYCCIDDSHLCFDTYRRPHIETDPGCGFDSHQYLFCAVQPAY